MLQGLFAFVGEDFHHLLQDRPEMDHIAWFGSIGLADNGPAFDAILRGKVTIDPDTEQVVVGYYGAAYLSNARYEAVVSAFKIDESRLIERRLHEAY